MSKAFTSEETVLPPEVHARPPPLEPRPLDAEARARLRAEGIVRRGARVSLQAEGPAVEYWLVGPEEADPSLGRLSVDSPLGRALLGKQVGDELNFASPRGRVDYELLAVRY